MYKLLILSNINPVTVTAIDLPTNELMMEAYEAADYNSLFGVIHGTELTYLNMDQFTSRYSLLTSAHKVNFDASEIKTIKILL